MNSFLRRKNNGIVPGKRITITGSAKNIGDQAAVVSDNAGVYYVDGLPAWEADWLHQMVRMTGELVYRENEATTEHDTSKYVTTAVVMLL
jgi:hypothetical protein